MCDLVFLAKSPTCLPNPPTDLVFQVYPIGSESVFEAAITAGCWGDGLYCMLGEKQALLYTEGPVATTGDSRGKVKVSSVAVPKTLAPEAEPAPLYRHLLGRELEVVRRCLLSHHSGPRSGRAHSPPSSSTRQGKGHPGRIHVVKQPPVGAEHC